jgi:hypothetical protein
VEDFELVSGGGSVARSLVERTLLNLGVTAPSDYIDLMASHDGAEGFHRGGYLMLFSLSQLDEINAERWEDMPWLVHFGGDGSNRSYAFDRRSTPSPIVSVDMIDHEDCESVGPSLSDLLAHVESRMSQQLAPELIRLAGTLHSAGNATAAEITRLTEATGQAELPTDYLQFLMLADGAEGFVGNRYIALWHAGEIIELNGIARTQEFAPGLFLVGTDGAVTGYGLDVRSARAQFLEVPLVGMSWARATVPRQESWTPSGPNRCDSSGAGATRAAWTSAPHRSPSMPPERACMPPRWARSPSSTRWPGVRPTPSA